MHVCVQYEGEDAKRLPSQYIFYVLINSFPTCVRGSRFSLSSRLSLSPDSDTSLLCFLPEKALALVLSCRVVSTEAAKMAGVGVTMDVGNDGVAIITFSNPPVNALALRSKHSNIFRLPIFSLIVGFRLDKVYGIFVCVAVLDGLKEKFVEATRREDVKAIVLIGECNS